MRRLLAHAVTIGCLAIGWSGAGCAADPPAPLVYTYADRDEWIESRSLIIDDGESVTVIGATSSYRSAQRLMAAIGRSTLSPLRRVLLDSSSISKAGGLAAFADAGVDVWASTHTARGVQQVVPYFAAERGDPRGELDSVLATRIATFDQYQVFSLAGSTAMEVIAQPLVCNANANSLVRLRTAGRVSLYVGSIIQTEHHPWFGGAIDQGVLQPDLERWQRCVDGLIAAGLLEQDWATDEGPQGRGDSKARAFSDYLHFVRSAVSAVITERVAGTADAVPRMVSPLARRVAELLIQRFPERRGDIGDLERSLTDVFEFEIRKRIASGRLGPRS